MKVLALLFSISVAEFVYPLAAYKRSGSKVIGLSFSWHRRILAIEFSYMIGKLIVKTEKGWSSGWMNCL